MCYLIKPLNFIEPINEKAFDLNDQHPPSSIYFILVYGCFNFSSITESVNENQSFILTTKRSKRYFLKSVFLSLKFWKSNLTNSNER